jgi:site-specific DNA-cytosine methylase
VWCLAERQFHGAFVENVANLLYVDKGRVYGTLLAVLEGIGYAAVAAVDCPLRHGIPHDRERAFISILRSDLTDKWGPPPALPAAGDKDFHHHDSVETFVPIEEFLLPPDHPAVVAEIAAFAQVLIDAGPNNNPRFVERDEEMELRWPHTNRE